MTPTTWTTFVACFASRGFFDGFGWDTGGTIIASVAAAAIAATIAVIGYSKEQRSQQRSKLAAIYGEAIRTVEDYMEAPYRIRRKDGTGEVRYAITSHISDVKSQISYFQGLLQLHAPKAVADAYDQFVTAAQREAGTQMTDAWNAPHIRNDDDVPIGVGHERTNSDAARSTLLAVMKADLGRSD